MKEGWGEGCAVHNFNYILNADVIVMQFLFPLTFYVKLPSSCSFIVDGLAVCCGWSHYMFRPIWPSSGV
jgi:hypothetical protein